MDCVVLAEALLVSVSVADHVGDSDGLRDVVTETGSVGLRLADAVIVELSVAVWEYVVVCGGLTDVVEVFVGAAE